MVKIANHIFRRPSQTSWSLEMQHADPSWPDLSSQSANLPLSELTYQHGPGLPVLLLVDLWIDPKTLDPSVERRGFHLQQVCRPDGPETLPRDCLRALWMAPTSIL